jgi:fumarate reductase subunit C
VTEPTDEKPKVRPWQWPREWWHDEKFWKDVASRSLSGAFVALLIFLTGLFFGYFKSPDVTLKALQALDWVLVVILGLFALLTAYEGFFSKKRSPESRALARKFSLYLTMGFVGFILLNLVDPVTQGL